MLNPSAARTTQRMEPEHRHKSSLFVRCLVGRRGTGRVKEISGTEVEMGGGGGEGRERERETDRQTQREGGERGRAGMEEERRRGGGWR